MRILRVKWLIGILLLLSASVVFAMGYTKDEIVGLFTHNRLFHLPSAHDINKINRKSIDALKLYEEADEPPIKPKEVPGLWACTCTNLPYSVQQQRGCSKGYAFASMTAATKYAQARCGQSCVLHCGSDVAMRNKAPAPTTNREPGASVE